MFQDTRLYLVQSKTACSIECPQRRILQPIDLPWLCQTVAHVNVSVFADAALNKVSLDRGLSRHSYTVPRLGHAEIAQRILFCRASPSPGIGRKSRECQTSITLSPQLSQISCPTPCLVACRLTHWLTCRKSRASVGSKATHSCSLNTQGNRDVCCFGWCRRMSASSRNKSFAAECSGALVKQTGGKMSHKVGIWPWYWEEREK